MVTASFGIFTVSQAGYGSAASTLPDNSLISAFHSVRPDDTVTLWGTGLGAVADDDVAPTPVDLETPVQVFVADQVAQITYHGRSGCCVGLDQINFVLPSAIEGCAVSISVQTGEIVSNYATNRSYVSAPPAWLW